LTPINVSLNLYLLVAEEGLEPPTRGLIFRDSRIENIIITVIKGDFVPYCLT